MLNLTERELEAVLQSLGGDSSIHAGTTFEKASGYSFVNRQKQLIVVPSVGRPWSIPDAESPLRYILDNISCGATLAELVSGGTFSANVFGASLGALLERGAISTAKSVPPVSPTMSEEAQQCRMHRVCVCVCGSIQAAFMLPYLLALRQQCAEHVEVVLTRAAERFLSRAALVAFGFRVWPAPQRESSPPVPHMWLAEHCEMIVIIPATANAIGRLAGGRCSDLMSLVVAATLSPVLVMPSMNPAMLRYPPIIRNLIGLRDDGLYIVQPSMGTVVSSAGRQTAVGAIGVTEASIGSVISAVRTSHHAERHAKSR